MNYGGWVNIPVPGYAGMTGSGGRKTPLQRNTFRLTVMLIGKLGTRKSYSMLSKLFRRLLESDEKPQRISLRLIKTKSGLKSFDLQLDKLPLTKSFINSVIETPMDLHKRRIQWAIDKLNEEGKALTVTNITAMTGVGNKYRKQVVEEIKRVLGEVR